MSDWSDPIDAYCERTDPTFWSEPVNALTNAGFLIAAALAWRLWRRAGGGDWPVLALIMVVVVVGIGSFLFHTVATRWASLADVIPIAIFIYGYFFVAMRRLLGLGAVAAALATAAFAGAAFGLAPLFRPLVGSSAGYVPALIALVLVAAIVWPRDHDAGRGLAAGTALFALSLAFRTVDLAVCPHWPLGTHFVWHLLNAALLYVLLATLIAAKGRAPAPA